MLDSDDALCKYFVTIFTREALCDHLWRRRTYNIGLPENGQYPPNAFLQKQPSAGTQKKLRQNSIQARARHIAVYPKPRKKNSVTLNGNSPSMDTRAH